MLYVVRALPSGTATDIVETVVEAEGEVQARAAAASTGLQVLSIHAVKPQADVQRRSWRSSDLAWWCRELRTLIGAGMTAVEGLETLQAQAEGSGMSDERQRVQAELLLHLHRGLALSQAMDRVGGFPSVLTASIRAAERTSALGEALDDYLRYHEVLDQLRRRVISAAIYPLLVTTVGIVVCAFLLVGVMPRFLGILEGTRVASTGATGLLIAASRWLNAHGVLAASGVAMLTLLGVWSWRTGRLSRMLLSLALEIPPVARTVQSFDMAKLYQALALLYRGGYPIEEALDVCRQAALADGSPMAARLAQGQQALMRGQGVAAALAASELTDEVSRRLLAVGERSGGADQILQVIAERHSRVVADSVDRLMRVIEPVMLLLVASAVGGVVVLMYLPIFDIATGLPS